MAEATLCPMKIIKSLFTFAAALSALIAAVLWYKSSVVWVELDPSKFDSTIAVIEGEKQTDFTATAREQTRWSKWAAAASALFQGIALLLS